MHYCGGKLVSTSINKETKSCCNGMRGCCENKTIHYEVKDDYICPIQVEQVKTVERDILFPTLFVLNFELFCEETKTTIVFHDSSPPPKVQTRLAFLQTYLS